MGVLGVTSKNDSRTLALKDREICMMAAICYVDTLMNET